MIRITYCSRKYGMMESGATKYQLELNVVGVPKIMIKGSVTD